MDILCNRDKLLSRSGAQLQSLSAFHDFMMYHNKSYSSKEEYKMRYNVFRSNMKIVEKLQVKIDIQEALHYCSYAGSKTK